MSANYFREKFFDNPESGLQIEFLSLLHFTSWHFTVVKYSCKFSETKKFHACKQRITHKVNNSFRSVTLTKRHGNIRAFSFR
ncbi:hypothetical protein RCL_jg3704.t1 [Rhizophagus clarus]|uniref:Uncharacterized protein n=1 Tax=Rhizophagus clarus TaxID=94130 RepID=A0A8H3M7J0_9GLOM|nr:hypothetical protein RCL_jg3704.t1 [Rhizophagus clarus]